MRASSYGAGNSLHRLHSSLISRVQLSNVDARPTADI